ncbi:MAG: MarR family transcriptional regulator [Actinomycetaceae bacterium]|nr:MarR family transcriptional regulator [Arcanobacterium sp.]MDD7504913.1 MarR family transcriptional regulator [Actinomycetaceae bacterium]MDY6143259.1 MarR family transcriptional regulator [Arcanobacterium sp.]
MAQEKKINLHPASLQLSKIFSNINRLEQEIAQDLGINFTDFRALSVLTRSGSIPVGHLAKAIGATAATTTAVLNRMEARGYIKREHSNHDRREVYVEISSEATNRLNSILTTPIAEIDGYVSSIDPNEQTAVTVYLEKVNRALEDYLASRS